MRYESILIFHGLHPSHSVWLDAVRGVPGMHPLQEYHVHEIPEHILLANDSADGSRVPSPEQKIRAYEVTAIPGHRHGQVVESFADAA